MLRASLIALAATLVATPNAISQGGPDYALEALTPEAEAIQVGLAGEDPGNIARYLMARGAGRTELSPDGQHIAFSSGVTGAPQLWVMPVTGGQARQITFGSGISFFEWSPTSETLIYGADNDGNEQEAFYSVSVDGTAERLVMPAVSGGFRRFGVFNADGSQFAFASTERNGLDFDIYMADTATGDARRVYEGKYGFNVQAISPDGKSLILAETVGEDSDNLHMLNIETGALKTRSKPSPRANHTAGGITWSADGKALYLSTNRETEFSAATRYDIADESFETLVSFEHDLGNIRLCGPDQRYFVGTTNEDGFFKLHVQDSQTGETLRTDLPEGTYQLSCGTQTNTLAIRINGWNRPGDIYTLDLATGDTAQVFRSDMAGLDPARLVRPQSVRITARDGVTLQGLLYLPDPASRADDGPPPVYFQVHGGPTGQSAASFDAIAQYHVDRGIAVFEPNVRGSSGFGRTYVTLDDRKNRLDSVRDLIDMLDHLGSEGLVDAKRAAVGGGSYGGYMVNAVLANYPGTFIAGVSLFGVADWVTALEVASPALKAADLIEYGDINTPEWREFYTENSPIRQADNIKVPVLYSHGVMDPRIDIFETETMVKALRANGIEAPYIRIPDEGHGWRKLANRLYYFRRQAEFLEAQFAKPVSDRSDG